ncbi:UDP-Glycosyltransferase/glycogen phosphorylase [Desarmillaria tabescens]|uniref:UDP-Glycosyltransferase/glycogen phosphorylase n=1 Tax=Armillaria tabescens TaxID=1929756 RepID=A0AA39KCT4_ARMTA|nr:UDP-Glycosyltransferase/glycogen phosphorylase [Desarmillaria tabescens]KAK0458622.1 UDP-Glycosyltransferase/glycogen phosphorylase [Desarmillaria tabescens]
MANEAHPFHMKEVDDDASILPKYAASSQSSENTSVGVDDVHADTDISYGRYTAAGKGLRSSAFITPDGRISVSLDLKHKLPELPEDHASGVKEFAVDREWTKFPKMNIVIMIVGSRGDVQPYVALGKRLRSDRHRVRIASHETFRTFVTENGLEFFDIGGNPQDLMSYMVKNPGLIPGMDSLTNGDIPKKRKMLAEMMNGCWLSCHSPCPRTGRTFAADAIIANPPSFAHIHCAEALGIPLLLSFSSYALVTLECNIRIPSSSRQSDILTWQGMGDIINKLRTRTLGLTPLSLRSGSGALDTCKVPWTYCMSPALVPKPKDWKNHIDVAGFYFLDLATNYTPPDDLAAFLAAGDAPIYIGFGSVVIDDPATMTSTIFEATKQAGVRALVSAGWGGLGGVALPPHIFILGNIPHDWLFANGRVAAVVHHGGAGTTAAGLSKGLPTVAVPFFGDQGFWGNMIHRAGAGPAPVPPKSLTVNSLKDAIVFAISPPAKSAARRMAEQILHEDGVKCGAESFYRHLPLKNMRCDLDPSRLAVWWSTKYCLKLSAFAAQVLVETRELDMGSLDAHRSKEYNIRKGVSDPVTGGSSAIFWTVTHYYDGIAKIFYSPVSGIVQTTTAIPQGVMKIVTNIHDGFHNMPKLYGSEVREPGKVSDFQSGLKEAGKGFVYGYYDGITGLVREPIKGAQKDGFVGAIKGSARSFVNVTMKPAAGIVGLFAHPMNGAWESIRSDFRAKQEEHQRSTRMSDGAEEVKRSTPEERNVILRRFHEAKATVLERQKAMSEAARSMLYEDVEEDATVEADPSVETTSRGDSDRCEADAQDARRLSPEQSTGLGLSQSDQDDTDFLRDMEIAKQLSLAEQRGYERGISDSMESTYA